MTKRNTYLSKVAVALSLSLLFTLLLMSPALAAVSENLIKTDDEPYRVESFDIDGNGNLEVNTSGGHITVEGSSSNTVRVEMFVRKNGRNLLPEDTDLNDWEIDISESGQTVKAIAKRNNSDNWNFFGNNNNVSISFVIYTPRDMSSELRTSGGHINTRGLSGTQNIATSGGHLELSNLKGEIDARTSGGHIDIADIQGRMEVRTSGGHINAENLEGELNARTSGGHIDLANVRGSVKATTSGGRISADLPSVNQFVELRTSGGNININLPKNMGLDLNLRGSYVSTNLNNFTGQIERDRVKGQLNGGGPQISARTSGGTVSLTFQ